MKQFTPELDAQCVEALQFAKQRIRDGRREYICNELEVAARANPELEIAVRILKQRIRNEIRGHDTLYGWLIHYVCIDWTDGTMDMCRMAWIDRMILDYLPESK